MTAMAHNACVGGAVRTTTTRLRGNTTRSLYIGAVAGTRRWSAGIYLLRVSFLERTEDEHERDTAARCIACTRTRWDHTAARVYTRQ